jgi:hypothetical protein
MATVRLRVTRAVLLRGLAFVSVLASSTCLADPANLSAPWKLNGNGYPGDVTVQQASDGRLSGTIYGDPLSGYYAPGERVGVWLRGPAGRPIQAFVGQVSPDGLSFSGRLQALNASNAGGSPGRNVYAFSALRAAASAPGNPGLPSSPAGPASIAGTHQLTGNGFAGSLQLNQATDGTLTGTVYGNPLEGHYANGTGSVAFIRYSAPGQPFQLFVGVVTPQGMRGEFYALDSSAGASPQRMKFEWSTQQQSTVLLAPIAARDPGATAPARVQANPSRLLLNSVVQPAPVTLTCPPNGFHTGLSRHTGWEFETIWQPLIRTAVVDPATMTSGAAVICEYGDLQRPLQQAAELLTLKRNAGFGVTAAMCAVAGGTFNCQGVASITCPAAYVGDVAQSVQRPEWTVSIAGMPLLRASVVDPPSMNAGTSLRCVYGTPANVPRPSVFSLQQNAGPGTAAASCTVTAASVTCARRATNP